MLIEPTSPETRELLQQLYTSFPSGTEFEVFLKILLNKMGLEDVTVTRYARDGGIDLTARRPGLEELSRVDEVKYVVQAKRYTPGRSVPIESVRALRGVMRLNDKGLFITTGRFSLGSEEFTEEDQARPIVLIDAVRLVRLCIDHEFGFRFRAVFDRAALLAELNRLPVQPALPVGSLPISSPATPTFVKTITSNDIRARIISTPWELDPLIDASADTLKVEFPPHFSARTYQYRRDRRYISGVTEVLRKFGLLDANGERHPRIAEWIMPEGSSTISVRIAHEDAGTG